MRQDRQSLV